MIALGRFEHHPVHASYFHTLAYASLKSCHQLVDSSSMAIQLRHLSNQSRRGPMVSHLNLVLDHAERTRYENQSDHLNKA